MLQLADRFEILHRARQYHCRDLCRIASWSVLLTDASLCRLDRSDEHDWEEMERRVRQCTNSPDMMSEFEQAVSEVWQNILWFFLENFIAPVRRRCVACVNDSGGQTYYW